MTTTTNHHEPAGLNRFAKFDHSISRMRIANHVHTPGWVGAMIYCLRHGDFKSAELIEARNSARVMAICDEVLGK